MKMIKNYLQTNVSTNSVDASLLLVRLVFGVAFMIHGFPKILAPFSWMGPDSGIPGVFLFLAALSEFGGGLALIIGLLTRLASLGMAFTMIVAVYTHMMVFKQPFIDITGKGSYEIALIYLMMALFFMVYGPGKFSLDSKVFGIKK
jgi:putative oxidoreductase